nr:Uncharacterised protein [Klebsiella pneumoniae]
MLVIRIRTIAVPNPAPIGLRKLVKAEDKVLSSYGLTMLHLGPTCARTDTLTPSSYCCH